MTPIRVLVVDDHSIVREGIRRVLDDPTTFAVVGEASSAAEAITAAASTAPDVVVLDVSMPGGSGLSAVPDVLERAPRARILMLSVHDDREYVLESVRVGAHGYMRKDSTPAELRAAVTAVHRGDGYFSPAVARSLAEAVHAETAPGTPPPPPRATSVLTPREMEILIRVAEGLTSRETGEILGISARTVEAHRESITRKLGVRTIAGLTRLAIEQGLLTREN